MSDLVVAGRRFRLLPVNMGIVRLIEESGYVGRPVSELRDVKAQAFMLDVVHASLARTARRRWWQVWRPRLSRAWLEEEMAAEDVPAAFARVCAETRHRRPPGEPPGEAARP